MSQNIVELTGVELALGRGRSRVNILRGIDLAIAAGETVGLVGPSGSGKSTLLMVMAGLERADAGRVCVAGTDFAGLGEDALARFRGRTMGVVFQSFHLIPNMTAIENVAVPLELAGEPDAMSAARDELAAVGLAERLDHYPLELSGGEQQRVAIARALVARPQILLADEPTGNLDEATGAGVADLLFAACRDRGMTLILVTHEMTLAKRCRRLVHLRSGRIASADDAREPPRRVPAQ
ncbi:MAG: ABC transporter ATP-binding protein [Bauldia sp.]|mgnify:CR=1 FL=1